MAKERKDNFNYVVEEGFDHIIAEGGNSSINVRRISWNDHPYKLDIRRYSYKDGKESMLKGISLSDEAAGNLAVVLIENGYGDTKNLLDAISKRSDFKEVLKTQIDNFDGNDEEEEYYDPNELLSRYGVAIEDDE